MTLKFNFHTLGFNLPNGLSCKNMFNFTCTNSKSNCTKCSICCGMTIATNNCFSRLSSARFRCYHVNNSLSFSTMSLRWNIKFFDIFSKSINLFFRNQILNIKNILCWNIVVKSSVCQIFSPNTTSCFT